MKAEKLFPFIFVGGLIYYLTKVKKIPPEIIELKPVPPPPHPGHPRLREEAKILKERIKEFEGYIQTASRRYQVPSNLIRAVIWAESSGRPRVHSIACCRGLMQVSEIAARDVGWMGTPEQLFNPGTNIDLGTKYLRKMYDRFGTWLLAISAYNQGPGSLEKRGPEFTREYNYRVFSYWKILKEVS